MRYFLGGHDNGEQELLVVRVPLLWLREQRAQVVNWSLDALEFAFFCTLDDKHCAHDAPACCYVEVQLFPFFRHRQDWRGRKGLLKVCECIASFLGPLKFFSFSQ